MKERLTELKGKIENSTTIIGKFSISLLTIGGQEDQKKKKKKVSKGSIVKCSNIKELKIELAYDPEIPLLSIYLKELKEIFVRSCL